MTSKSTPPAKLTYADFVLFPDDGRRHELIDGEHYVTPSPSLRHQTISGRLYLAIAGFLEQHPLGQVWTAPLDVVLSNVDVVEPDLLYVSRERSDVLTAKNIQGAPDLVIEILSRGTRRIDIGVKRDAYKRFGIAEYWVVDPESNTAGVYRSRGGEFETAGDLTAENADVLTTPLLPGLRIELNRLFRD